MFDEMPTDAPYRLLIRARTELEFDRAVLSIAVAIARTITAADVAEKLGPALTRSLAATAVSAERAPSARALPAAKVVAAMKAVAFWEDGWCGTPPRPWPWPPRWPWPWPWPPFPDPSPDPWREIDILRIPALTAIVELAKLTELGGPIVEIGQEMLKEQMG